MTQYEAAISTRGLGQFACDIDVNIKLSVAGWVGAKDWAGGRQASLCLQTRPRISLTVTCLLTCDISNIGGPFVGTGSSTNAYLGSPCLYAYSIQ